MKVKTTNNIKPLNAYSKALRNICPELSDEEITFMLNSVTITELKAKEMYLKPGDVQESLVFSYRGLLRSFYINDKGEDITISFIKENNYATDYGAFISQQPSKYFIETLEPCILINVSYNSIQECYSKFKNCEKYGRVIAEKHLIREHNRINDFLFNNAEQRYINFISKHADILNRISVTNLSSYLGMKRQTLTRIRKELTK
jgi:CRP-like cAMP-binding protein